MAKIVSTLRKVASEAETAVALEGKEKSSSLITALGVLLIATLIVGSFVLVFAASNM